MLKEQGDVHHPNKKAMQSGERYHQATSANNKGHTRPL